MMLPEKRCSVFTLSIFVLAALSMIVGSQSALAQISMLPWLEGWAANGPLHAVAPSEDAVYLGGAFTYIGRETGTLAQVDSAGALDDGKFPQIIGTVYATVSDGAGGWYVGGDFLWVETVACERLIHIMDDGSLDPDWTPEEGIGVNGPVYALALSENRSTLFIGGDFTSINGTARRNLAAVNTVTRALRSWNPRPDGAVRAFAQSHDKKELYTGGSFKEIAGREWPYLVSFHADPEASDFGELTPWDPEANGHVEALCYAEGIAVDVEDEGEVAGEGEGEEEEPGEGEEEGEGEVVLPEEPEANYVLYVGGWFSQMGERFRNHLAAINAETAEVLNWNPAPNNPVFALDVDEKAVYAAGAFTRIGLRNCTFAAALDRASGDVFEDWQLGRGDEKLNDWVTAVKCAPNELSLYLAGHFTWLGNAQRARLARVNADSGTVGTWNPGAGDMSYVLQPHTQEGEEKIQVAGKSTVMNGGIRHRLAAFNKGSSDDPDYSLNDWNPHVNNPVYGLACSEGEKIIYAGGLFDKTGNNGDQDGYSDSRTALAAITADSVFLPFADLTSEIEEERPLVRALALSDSLSIPTLYIGGSFSTLQGLARSGLGAVNASYADSAFGNALSWEPDLFDTCHALDLSEDESLIFAGGETDDFKGILAALDTDGMPVWDFTADYAVQSLEAIEGDVLYVGGSFTQLESGGNIFSYLRLARIEDSQSGVLDEVWRPAIVGSVLALWAGNGDQPLFIGGNFTQGISSESGESHSLNHLAAISTQTQPVGYGDFLEWRPSVDGPVYLLTPDIDKPYFFVGGVFTALGQENALYRSISSLALFAHNDLVPPEITLIGEDPQEIECGDDYIEAGALATDNWDGNLTEELVIDSSEVNTAEPGTYTVYYSVQDGSGNEATAERTVEVSDNLPPVIELVGDPEMVLECNMDVYEEFGARAFDYCEGALNHHLEGTVDTTQPGSYMLTYEAVDSSGNEADPVVRLVHVIDSMPPVFSETELPYVTVELGHPYDDEIPEAFDMCQGLVPVDSDADTAVRIDEKGQYIVTYSADDGENQAEITRTVYVVDPEKPYVLSLEVLSPSSILVTFNKPMSARASMVNYYSLSGSGLGTLTARPHRVVPDAADPASYLLEWNSPAEMYNGGALRLTVNKMVTDADDNALEDPNFALGTGMGIKPVITILGDNPEYFQCAGDYEDAGATAFDDPDGVVEVTVEGLEAFSEPEAGIFEITYRAQDLAGNVGTATRIVEVQDDQEPVITLVGDSPAIVECGYSYVDPGVSAYDVCDGDLTDSIVTTFYTEEGIEVEEIDTQSAGIFLIFYQVSDKVGNEAVPVIREVEVVDTNTPLFLWIGSSFEEELPVEDGFYVLECSEAFVEPVDFTAADLCDGYLEGPVSHLEPGEAGVLAFAWALDADKKPLYGETDPLVYPYDTFISHPGDYLLCYVAYDASGNTYPAVDDDGMPELSYPLFLDENLEALVVDYARLVRVVDTRLPVIELNSNAWMQWECTLPFVDPVTAFDDCAGDLTAYIVITGSVNTGELGVHALSYSVSDFEGNAALPQQRQVEVVDTIAPVISLNTDEFMVIECSSDFIDPVTAFDDCTGDLTAHIVTTGFVNTGVLDSYVLTYNVSDSSGNAAETVTRTVTVEDTEKPVLSGPDEFLLECGSPFDPMMVGVTAFDDCAGDLTPDMEVTGTVLTHEPGIYTLEYTVSDPTGNAADPHVLTVEVRDSIRPVLDLNGPSSVEVECGDDWDDPVTAFDSCAGDLTAEIVTTPPVNTEATGTFTVTYTVSDPSGNEAESLTRTIIVEDTMSPEIHLGVDFPNSVTVVDGFVKWLHGQPFDEPDDFNIHDACEGDLSPVHPQLPPMTTEAVIGYAWALDPVTKEPLWNTPQIDPLWFDLDDFVNHEGYYLMIYEARDSVGNHTPVMGTGGFVPIFDDDFNPNFLDEDGELRSELSFARLVWVSSAKTGGLPFKFAQFVVDTFGAWDRNGDGILDDDEQKKVVDAFIGENQEIDEEELLQILRDIQKDEELSLALLKEFLKDDKPSEGEELIEGEVVPEGEATLEGEAALEGEVIAEGEATLEGEAQPGEGELQPDEGEFQPDEGEDAAVGCCRTSKKSLSDVFGDLLLLGLSLMVLLTVAGGKRRDR
ncbi:MAG: DUF5011 domain-containing protein [Candidatus Hydrogenedens sp.]|nr:DUF5011 domain-containing protein [Candidatus Hydrogenedens sp.]